MTNGEKIKEIFPSMIVGFITESQIGIYFVKNQHSATVFSLDWWNAEYKDPTTKNDLGLGAVSRQAVLELIADNDLSMGQVVRSIHALPSVTPQELRKGHWISTETKGVRYAFWCRYKCSLCGELSDYKNFCPNCGADMREVKE